MHHRLFHLSYSIMFRTLKAGLLPNHYLHLKYQPPPCASCMFGAHHRTNWRTKSSNHGKKSELIKEDFTNPGQYVGVDQMISTQPVLIPKEKLVWLEQGYGPAQYSWTITLDTSSWRLWGILLQNRLWPQGKSFSTAALFGESKSIITMQIMEDLLNLHG